ncbi:S-layer homology domain-containing protein [Leptolyngbya ohadii]|uniref:S-layer homology domain-containing protein n=1 Tax=Leptolyngbya ohadii TaxID=1962290 RepID=UPI001CED967A|nr:S-layer homology domain-containing protein [Leptolyngbya ohadii]
MSAKHAIVLTGLMSCLLSLGACSNSPWAQSLERSIAADPRLQSSPSASPSSGETQAQLPANFPAEIPRYPQAELVQVTPSTGLNSATQPGETQSSDTQAGGTQSGETQSSGTQTQWATTNPAEQVQQFYQTELNRNGWQLTQPATPGQPLTATREGLQVTVTVPPTIDPSRTLFSIAYQFTDTAQALPSPTAGTSSGSSSGDVPQPGDPNFVGPVLPGNSVAQQPGNSANPTTSPVATAFTDLDQAPAQLRSYIVDLEQLNALPLQGSNAAKSGANEFKPNQAMTRREYARWLVTANNLLYANQAARQIRLAASTEQPVFQDVKPTDPDFGAIQALANAGLIPSPLSGSTTTVTFRPDAPLTREDLILWKVPIDTRQALPNASIDAVQQTWGFQDAARIDPQSLKAVLADFQNGDQSNIRRAFGYTTLFQPKKSVSRAEAAAVLWQFGTSTDSITAKDALQGGTKPAPVGP